jgi:serine phosphatase RsbU (regulator of sigma subunit)/predicted ester cyclase
VPGVAKWHHAWCRPGRETLVGKEEEAPVSSEEEKNKALVRRFVEAQWKKDLAALEEMMAPDFVDHSVLPGQGTTREDYLQDVAEDQAASSDAQLSIEDQMAEDDRVITRLAIHGSHDQEMFTGVPPTGVELKFTGIIINRVVGGKIVEEWSEGTYAYELAQQRLDHELRERERIEQELLVARRIQQASLPKEVPKLEGWQINPFYQPAREVGGDFYDFHLLSEGRVGLVVGDATGKGVPAALVMSTTCGMLQAVSQASDSSSSSPGEVLKRVNEALTVRIPPNMFVTCFYAILEPESGRLSYANAGHDLPYLYCNGDAEELRARGMPLGLMPGMSYEEKQIELDIGEGVFFYSDGLVEAHEPNGEMFGFPRLRELIAEHGEERALGDFLLEQLHLFVGEGWEQEDDITLLTLQRCATLR